MTPSNTPYAPPRPPMAFDRQPEPASTVLLDGTTKQCLEVGRTRLLAAGLVLAMAFAVVGLRLVGVSLLTDGQEPRAAETPRATAFETVRAAVRRLKTI